MKTLFKNALILLTDKEKPSSQMFSFCEGDILVDGEKIAKIGKGLGDGADKVIDCTDKLVMPGLINAHTHAYMTLFRNSADDIPFAEWLFDNMNVMEDNMAPDDAYWGTMLAAVEMIRTGTTSFLDMHMNIHENARAVRESGMRAVLTRGLVGDVGDEAAEDRIRQAKEEMEAWKDEKRLSFMLAPHAPFTCTEKFMCHIAEEAEKLGVGINIHLAESEGEIGMIKERYGVTPAELVLRTGLFDRHAVAAHCVRLTDSDMDILKDKGVSVVTNPVSNMKLGNGFARLVDIDEHGINVAIGTDGAGSNNTLNLFHEMSVAALIHKGVRLDAVSVSASDVLRYATVGGAKALGLEDRIGELKEGYEADIIVMDLKKNAFVPRTNIISTLAYCANGSEVCTVMVAGKLLMEDNELLTLDEEKIREEVCRRTARLLTFKA